MFVYPKSAPVTVELDRLALLSVLEESLALLRFWPEKSQPVRLSPSNPMPCNRLAW